MCASAPRTVFPAYAGVFLSSSWPPWSPRRLPRIRGGVSLGFDPCEIPEGSSPHTRGCFQAGIMPAFFVEVFPAYAGVFPHEPREYGLRSGLPRIRGGVSRVHAVQLNGRESSPHTRGCFTGPQDRSMINQVFPAYAGVFLHTQASHQVRRRLPRIRGGVSLILPAPRKVRWSSPHTRGCFPLRIIIILMTRVFPAYAGVFPPVELGGL